MPSTHLENSSAIQAIHTNMSSIYDLENLSTNQVIAALYADMGNCSGEVAFQVLEAVVNLLKHSEQLTTLSLDQIMVGAINMAVCLQISKYGNITLESIGQAAYDKYHEDSEIWFVSYNEQLENLRGISSIDALKLALPVIERASRSPLCITPLLHHTLNLYFEFLKSCDSRFTPPELPTGNTFGSWERGQFKRFNTKYSSSLVDLSLFAIKKHRISSAMLPTDLQNRLAQLPSAKGGDHGDDSNTSIQCCVII